MFSFHKPKVYRSSTGCCICKAKSSSSRFTDSKKYELDFIECFQLATPRKGEICNACVLLVKRFKRLPPGSDRHWGHVVDARVGPGLKSMTKFKKRKEDQVTTTGTTSTKKCSESVGQRLSSMPERFCKIFKKTKKKKSKIDDTEIKKEKDNSGNSSDEDSSPNSPASSSISDGEPIEPMDMVMTNNKTKRKNRHPCKNRKTAQDFNIIDAQIWKKRRTCCGLMYESALFNAIIIDVNHYKPCKIHVQKKSPVSELERELECTSEDLLIKLTDEQIQENYENASLSGFNKIVKLSDLFAGNQPQPAPISQPPLKKHHMYSKRGLAMVNAVVPEQLIVPKTDCSPIISGPIKEPIITTPKVSDPLHKIRADNGGKIMKNSMAALKLKPLDFKVKDLVKICAEKAVKSKQLNGAAQEGVIGDNSSDSGYEEAHDQAQNLMQKPKTTPKQVMLSNGIRVNVQQQNLLLAANLAGLPQTIMPAPFLRPSASEASSVIRLQQQQQSSSHIQKTSSQSMIILQPGSNNNNHHINNSILDHATTNEASSVISLATTEQLPLSPPPMVSPTLH